MKRALAPLLLALAIIFPSRAAEPVIRLVEFETTVNPATSSRILGAIEDAEREGDALVLIELDTPGGFLASLEDIVKGMLAAKVPIVVWVGPSGARAASAGFLILIAADVAAMAPGTRTGAASPVYGTGKTEEGDILQKKATQDVAALARTIAEHRGRNVEACEKAVLSADAYTDSVALKDGIIDLVAQNRNELLDALDGREVRRFDGTTVVLQTAGARIVASERDWKQAVLEFLANPAVAALLLLLGLGGLFVELYNPGLIFPGVIGAMSLVLFAFASQQLSVSTVGILLILLAIVMFILEIKVVSYGMLTLGGAVCLTIGFLMLFQGPIPELRVPWTVAVPASVTLAVICAVAMRLAVKAHRAPVATGVEGLRGETGRVFQDLDPEGKVFVHGEIWDAVSRSGRLERGRKIRVTGVDEMVLTVEPVENGSARQAS